MKNSEIIFDMLCRLITKDVDVKAESIFDFMPSEDKAIFQPKTDEEVGLFLKSLLKNTQGYDLEFTATPEIDPNNSYSICYTICLDKKNFYIILRL